MVAVQLIRPISTVLLLVAHKLLIYAELEIVQRVIFGVALKLVQWTHGTVSLVLATITIGVTIAHLAPRQTHGHIRGTREVTISRYYVLCMDTLAIKLVYSTHTILVTITNQVQVDARIVWTLIEALGTLFIKIPTRELVILIGAVGFTVTEPGLVYALAVSAIVHVTASGALSLGQVAQQLIRIVSAIIVVVAEIYQINASVRGVAQILVLVTPGGKVKVLAVPLIRLIFTIRMVVTLL